MSEERAYNRTQAGTPTSIIKTIEGRRVKTVFQSGSVSF
jgi:hypothetical protein